MRVQVTNQSGDPVIAIAQEAVKRERLLEGLRWLETSGAILRGHFRFGTGRDERHGAVYIRGRLLFSVPYASRWLTQSLYDALPDSIRADVQLVAGPQTAGIIMSRDLADTITSSRKQDQPQVEAVFLDKDGDGGYLLHESDEERVRGRRVVIVDDVRHRGATFASCARLLADGGGHVIATAELIDRGLPVIPLSVPNFFVGQLDPERLYRKEDCPQCGDGTPITTF